MNKENVPLNLWVEPRNGLHQTHNQFQTMPCRIAYLGASVTVQKDGYRPHLHEWLVETYGQAHQAINAGFGGVGSISGVFTMDEQVVRFRPQLCFIEFSSGDMAAKTSLSEIGPVIEGMVRKLYAINCAVCFLYLYRSDQTFEKANSVLNEYEKVASHYSVPTINIGQWLETQISFGDLQKEEVVRDVVHTTAWGTALTVNGVTQALKLLFHTSSQPIDSLFISTPLYTKSYENTEIVRANARMLEKASNCVTSRFRFVYSVIEIDDTNEFRLRLPGELVGLLVVIGPDSGFIEVKTQDSVQEFLLWDDWCYYHRLQTVILTSPIAPHSLVSIRLTGKDVVTSPTDIGSLNPHKTKKRLKMIGFLVRNDDTNSRP